MIEKIGPNIRFDPALPSKTLARQGIDFRSFLKERLDEAKPLQRMALEYLKNVVDAALSVHPLPLLPHSPIPNHLTPGEGKQIPPFLPGGETSEFLLKKEDLDVIVREAGKEFGVDPSLIRAVVQAESGGNPMAVSSVGAKGLMQLMPGTAAELGVGNPFDPLQNVRGGTRYLRKLLDRYQGDIRLTLAAYNWGMGNVETRPEAMPGETRNYILRVEKAIQKT